ncbi:hypothetical protein UZ36_07890, partial [Candidatus Nitromaritima sp. SCGC AAA799-C22]
DMAELNLLGHIFTRTRKREVHENFPHRRAHALQLELSPMERDFYEAVTNFVRAETEDRGLPPVIQQWVLNMPQRRMASSIPAMVDYYRNTMGLDKEDLPEDMGFIDIDSDEDDINASDLESARKRLAEIVRKWPSDGLDTKYKKFAEMLRQLRETSSPMKVLKVTQILKYCFLPE